MTTYTLPVPASRVDKRAKRRMRAAAHARTDAELHRDAACFELHAALLQSLATTYREEARRRLSARRLLGEETA